MRALIVLALVLVAAPARAQHPCDQPAPATQTVPSGVPHKLQFCQPVTDYIEALIVWLDATPYDLLPVLPLTAPSPTGLVLYETALLFTLTPGLHGLTAAVYNRDAATGAWQYSPYAPTFLVTGAGAAVTPPPSIPDVRGAVR